MRPFQPVVGDTRAQMMNVVETDISGEPLKDPRKFIERTALQGRIGKIPLRFSLPIHILELVLHVEKPNTSRAGDQQRRQLDDEIAGYAKDRRERHSQYSNRQIRRMNPKPSRFLASRAGMR